MERRDFLAAFAATAASVAAKPVDVEPPLPEEIQPLTPPPDMDAYLARVDSGLVRIEKWSPTEHAASFTGDRVATDTLARASLQSLFLTGMLGDLPIPSQLHPGMQDRVWRAMPLFDQATDGMSTFLKSRTDNDLARVHDALRSASVRERIAAELDSEAMKTGVSAPRRAQLQQLVHHVAWRLAEQPPALIIDEYVDKVEKVAESDVESAARQRQLAARVGEEAFWALDERSTRDQRIARGAKTLGIGALTLAVGGGIVAAGAFPGVFVMTVGVIMMLVGLIMLLVGVLTPGPSTTAASSGSP
jgi:hypothetical protein